VDLAGFLVQADEERVREAFVLRQELSLNPLEGCQVTRLLRSRVGGVDAPILVATDVLEVDDVLVILRPEVDANPAQAVSGDRPVILASYT
jgi:hypothetical protein